jgi:amino acid transporter
MGQPRIWMSMSRDGLLPKKFSRIHPKFKTPSYATVVVGFVVAVPALFMNLTMVTDLCSIGTLFAFVLVCGGVLVLQNKPDIPRGKFRTPYVNGKYVMPLLLVGTIVLLFSSYKTETMAFLQNDKELKSKEEIIDELAPKQTLELKTNLEASNPKEMKEVGGDITAYYEKAEFEDFSADVIAVGFNKTELYKHGFNHFAHKIPTWIFILFTIFITFASIAKNLSLIPLLGLLSCLYMMSQIQLSNWLYFMGWLVLGLVIYFGYSRRNSKLNAVVE